MSDNNKKAFIEGMRDGIPIGMGYLAVSFSLGITAHNAGLSAFQSFLASLLCNASAGEYAGFTLISENAAYIEIAIITLIANARYFLMSFAMSQKLAPTTAMRHRFFLSYDIADELFAITMARQGYLNPFYTYGAVLVAAPCWATGTALGNIAGNILPEIIVSALSVALFGMFLAVIIPPSKKSKILAGIILICFVLSYIFATLPLLSDLSGGMRTIILTVAISSASAILFPIENKEELQK